MVSFVSFCGIPFVSLGVWLLSVGNTLAVGEPAQGQRVLRLARTYDPQTLDPARVLTLNDYLVLQLLYLPLLDIPLEGLVGATNLLCIAAGDWSASADARTYTFRLRPEIKFSNGRPVVAADYAHALERIIDPRTRSPSAVPLLDIRGAAELAAGRTNHLVGVRAEGDHTLVVELDNQNLVFRYQMAFATQAAVPREEVERLGTSFEVHPVGSGPYVVEEWVRGVRLVFAPNPHYAGPEPRYFDRIEIMIGGDASTHLMMFERGELDIASIEARVGIPIADHHRMVRSPRWGPGVEQSPTLSTTFVVLNTEMPPLDNPRVRQAINYAVDKPRRLRSGNNGRYTPAKGIIPPIMPGYNPHLRGYGFDPQRAQDLLAESGVSRPFQLTLWHPTDQEPTMIAQGIQADLHAVDIDVELKPVTASEIAAACLNRGRVQMAFLGYDSGIPDPQEILSTLFDGRTVTNATTLNYSFYCNPEVNRLFDAAAASTTQAIRFALYQQAEEIIVRDAPFLFLGHWNLFALKQPWVKGRFIDPSGAYRLDRVWIER